MLVYRSRSRTLLISSIGYCCGTPPHSKVYVPSKLSTKATVPLRLSVDRSWTFVACSNMMSYCVKVDIASSYLCLVQLQFIVMGYPSQERHCWYRVYRDYCCWYRQHSYKVYRAIIITKALFQLGDLISSILPETFVGSYNLIVYCRNLYFARVLLRS